MKDKYQEQDICDFEESKCPQIRYLDVILKA